MSINTLTLAQVEARNVEHATGNAIPENPQERSQLDHRLVQTWGAGGRTWEQGKGVCKVCGESFCRPGEDIFRANIFGMEINWPTPVCDKCGELVLEIYGIGGSATSAHVSLTPNWDENCPPRFKEAVDMPSLPAHIDAAAYRTMREWRWSSRGLYAVGASGTGKTAALWALARDLERAGDRPLVIGAVELGRRLQQAAKDLTSVPDLCFARILMIDDLGKERATPAASSLFSEVLDHRYSHRLPVIITTRFSSKELRARFAEPSIGQDITRRLYEICAGLSFNQPNARADDSN